MGNSLTSQYGAAPLIPQDPEGPCNILKDPQFIWAEPCMFLMREKMLSFRDNAGITYPDGRPYMQVKGKIFSLRDKHTVETLSGDPVFHIQSVIFSLMPTYEVYYGADASKKALTISEKFQCACNFTKQFNVCIGDDTSNPRIVVLADKLGTVNDECAGFFGFLGDPTKGGALIFKFLRRVNVATFFGASTYEIHIAPGVDIAMVLAIACAIDQYQDNEQKKD